MARLKRNIITSGISGSIGKQIVFKQYGDITIISAYPDMSRVKPSESQKNERKKFGSAMAYAKRILKDPSIKAAYAEKTKGLQKIHNIAVSDFIIPHY
ncbi:MAG: hypothetical protein HC906_04085 [Bacteroidales bacterium]|nr:hypothetical protein [Bacteroidales bacterium]